MTPATELKPCPWGANHVLTVGINDSYVMCVTAGCPIWHISVGLHGWNRRFPAPSESAYATLRGRLEDREKVAKIIYETLLVHPDFERLFENVYGTARELHLKKADALRAALLDGLP